MASLLVSVNRTVFLGLKVYTLCNICRSSPIIPVDTSDVSVKLVISGFKRTQEIQRRFKTIT